MNLRVVYTPSQIKVHSFVAKAKVIPNSQSRINRLRSIYALLFIASLVYLIQFRIQYHDLSVFLQKFDTN